MTVRTIRSRAKSKDFYEDVRKHDTVAFSAFSDLECLQRQNEFTQNEGFHDRYAKWRKLDPLTMEDGRLVEDQCAETDVKISGNHEEFD